MFFIFYLRSTIRNVPEFLLLVLLGTSIDKHHGFYQVFLHHYNSPKSGTYVPVNE